MQFARAFGNSLAGCVTDGETEALNGKLHPLALETLKPNDLGSKPAPGAPPLAIGGNSELVEIEL